MVTLVVALAVALELGALLAAWSQTSRLTALEASGDSSGALSLGLSLGRLHGPQYLFAAPVFISAASTTERAALGWAGQQLQGGNPGTALSALGLVTDPTLASQRQQVQARALLAEAQSALTAGRPLEALAWLGELQSYGFPLTLAAEVDQISVKIQLAAVPALITAGQAQLAVDQLDTSLATGGTAARRQANLLMPSTLLAAARQAASNQAFQLERQDLDRIIGSYPATPAAASATQLEQAPQPVCGTVIHRDGTPIQGPLRLATSYAAGASADSAGPPYISSEADTHGDFLFARVPVGGPYVLEVFTGGQWATLVDPSTGQPAHPVQVVALQPTDLGFIVVS